ncbi:choloylglycine hydrolase family protein [Vibrio breoganii]|uniref:choloylglycine hydrolase family protein n=1 Tax=Vibrio breoganii TaxID=553239 RepID=UPI0021C32C2E|nr:choloylglycine hydrolase family protein [Vibrio breoganii]MDN3715481.1 choloylglycine hydrolase family protein [Vibrio breoganii]
MKTPFRKLALASMLAFTIPAQSVLACTAITLNANDGSIIQARTQEWGAFDLRSEIIKVPQNVMMKGNTPEGTNGLTWESKYGAVGINAVGLPVFIDGMNQEGLAVSVLYMPGFAQFQDYESQQSDITLAAYDLPAWLLTTKANVEEIKTELPNIRVSDVKVPSFGNIAPPIHFLVTDSKGGSIVIEYTNGELAIYDNEVGVMTNSPSYPWHLTNLRNYVGLQPESVEPKQVGNITLSPIGVGSGMLGLPGDFTPPSRFVRAVAMRNTVVELEDSERAINESFRILDNFNIPLGATEAPDQLPTDGTQGSTQWTTAMNAHSLEYYYHTMNNRTLRKIDLKEIDFTKGEITFYPLDKKKVQTIEMVEVD